MEQQGEETNYLAMSDDDILNMTEPTSPTASDTPVESVPEEPADTPAEPETEVEEEVTQEQPDTEDNSEEEESTDKPVIDTPTKTTTEANKPAKEPVTENKEEQPAEPTVNYEERYKQIMAPFKANGKEIKLDNPDDAIKLMQMGANYTKKLQALQPNLKLLKMLENQGLLDEGKLNNLIDIHRRNPKAIQQLVKDSGIDPLEIDTTQDSGYVPGNHAVSEQELQFSNILDDVTATQEGADIVVAIDKQWDDASKQAIYKEPQILNHLLNQKQAGIYDQIVTEVEKQRMLGNLVNVPFIHAYHTVGQQLAAQKQAAVPTKTVLETRTAKPKSATVNADKARAASPTKAAPKSIKQVINPLEMSDEDFLKMAHINL